MSQAARPFTDRERNIYLAKLCEGSERYEDMINYMKAIIDAALSESEPSKRELTVEERNLLSVAYKNVIGARRSSWRAISHVEGQTHEVEDEARSAALKEFRERVEAELEKTCADIEKLLEEKLIPSTTTVEGRVFYYKMSGDYYRYQTEFRTPPSSSSLAPSNPSAGSVASAESARLAYATALSHASSLSPTNPIRLGLALNFSVYYYEVAKDSTKACELAKSAFDDAMAELDTLSEESYKDSTLIMQLLRDNLGLWTQQSEEPIRNTETAAPAAVDQAPEAAAEAQPVAA